MAQSFKHIKVTPADNDEVVIIAGAPNAADDDVDAGVTSNAEDAYHPTTLEASEPSARAEAATKKGAVDAYHPTTLEDIESSKMPKTQIAVIVVAVVVLVAFAIWFFVLT